MEISNLFLKNAILYKMMRRVDISMSYYYGPLLKEGLM